MDCQKLVRIPETGVKGPVVVAIMDGVGIGKGDEGDAVAKAHTPTLDRIAQNSLTTQLAAHGLAVGMPSDEDMGNSEVGHNALGAGRIFDQGAKLVQSAIESGKIFAGEVWQNLITHIKQHNTALHFIGLLSDGNVHSNISHLIHMIRKADNLEINRLYVHALLDGRDVPKTSALEYVDQLEAVLIEINKKANREYKIASGGGRMVTTMDRYQADWTIVERGWQTHVLANGPKFVSARAAIEAYRKEKPGILDQDLPPFVVVNGNEPIGPIKNGDGVVAYNFRGDRMLELVSAFENEQFNKFNRGPKPDVFFTGMTLYDGDTNSPNKFLVAPPEITCTIGELLVDAGVVQLATSETQKYGHVTYFFNGNRSGYFSEKLEKYIEVPSNAPPFDEKPEMKAFEISQTLLRELEARDYKFLRLNWANGDMVGHTGNFAATVKGVEAVDQALAMLIDPVLARGGALIVTADHGNADDMGERHKKTGQLLRDENGLIIPKTSHSLNPVPFHVVLSEQDRKRFTMTDVKHPGLGNVAATISVLLGFKVPDIYLPSIIQQISQ
ncbi:MAG: 2,3-bisphosphoglycerate-independent phosphoglycerate mutase [Deltaproteobacteria bacterium]|nr:2,3-bisphosphoglycerate-independent phosphoglycerate mutase [Deltaproteobacteria bacterium]